MRIYMHSMHQPKGNGWRSACPEARACRRVRARDEAKERMEDCNRLGLVFVQPCPLRPWEES